MKKFSKEHEWISVSGGIGTVGITDYAQKQLGDVVYIAFTRKPGDSVQAGEDVAEIESVKSVSQVFTPVSGTVSEYNDSLSDEANTVLVNQDPYVKGWIFKIKVQDEGEMASLMDEKAYESYIASL